MENKHESVLLLEAVNGLDLHENDIVVDATVGGAGHFKALLEKLGPDGVLVGIDADPDAITRGRTAAAGARATVELVEGNFRDMGAMLDRLQIGSVNKVLFDLGWSSFHLAAGRGFSFKTDEPLIMTYGTPTAGNTAADMVNSASEEALADLLYTLGEERFARQIARSIVRIRETHRIVSTFDLVRAVEEGTPGWYHHRRIHPATKTFQALRIAVNDELGALRAGLATALERVSVGGRIAVISFHSIEDRIVKSVLRDAAHAGLGTLLNKKPIAPSLEECTRNPRARSAKLRIFEKCVMPSSAVSKYSAFTYA